MTQDGIDAPWNEDNEMVDVNISITLNKTFNVAKRENVYDALNEICLPNELAAFTKKIFNMDLDLKAAKMPLYLKEAIEDSINWEVTDCDVIEIK